MYRLFVFLNIQQWQNGKHVRFTRYSTYFFWMNQNNAIFKSYFPLDHFAWTLVVLYLGEVKGRAELSKLFFDKAYC